MILKKIIHLILMELHIFSITEYENVDFRMPSVCLYVCMNPLLVPECFDRFCSYSVFRSYLLLVDVRGCRDL